MTQEHLLIPSQQLIDKWVAMFEHYDDIDVLTEVAQWGADQELEACCEWLLRSLPGYDKHYADYLRTARRPKPLSLKEQALAELDLLKADATTHGLGFNAHAIRRALESLPE